MDKSILVTGAFFGMLAVILGAFGAHALKDLLDAPQIATFETGVRYQMYHAIFLLFLGLSNISKARKKTIFYLLITGIFLFSGSIYLLATDSLNQFNFKVIGFVTPVGGLFLIVAWALLLLSFLNKKSQNREK